MNKFFVSTLTAAVLTTAAVASQAADITYELLSGATPYTTAPTGVAPTAESPGQTISDFFVPNGANPQSFGTPSVLVFGDDLTTPGNAVANTGAMWANVPISFKFKVDVGTSIGVTAQTFTASGIMNGVVGYNASDLPESMATVTYTSIVDNTNGDTSILTTDPENGVKALELITFINGTPVDIWLDKIASKAAPGQTVNHTGYINSTAMITPTPEPGTVAMIVGMGISGGVFLRRKRRA